MSFERIPGYDYEAALDRINAAEQRKADAVWVNKQVNRQRGKTARKQRRANRKRGT